MQEMNLFPHVSLPEVQRYEGNERFPAGAAPRGAGNGGK